MKLFAKLPAHRLFALFGAPFLCAYLTSSVVRAECGDYVIVGGKSDAMDWRSMFARLNVYRTGEPITQAVLRAMD
jgi:hypothetical protein